MNHASAALLHSRSYHASDCLARQRSHRPGSEPTRPSHEWRRRSASADRSVPERNSCLRRNAAVVPELPPTYVSPGSTRCRTFSAPLTERPTCRRLSRAHPAITRSRANGGSRDDDQAVEPISRSTRRLGGLSIISTRSDRASVGPGIGRTGRRSDRASVGPGIGRTGHRSNRASVEPAAADVATKPARSVTRFLRCSPVHSGQKLQTRSAGAAWLWWGRPTAQDDDLLLQPPIRARQYRPYTMRLPISLRGSHASRGTEFHVNRADPETAGRENAVAQIRARHRRVLELASSHGYSER